MPPLELRVPPPAVMLTAVLLMALLDRLLPGAAWRLPGHWGVAAALALLGVAVALTGVLAFRRAQTTVSPLAPERATALVTTGVYARSRNPMYLGLLLMLAGWGAYLGHAAAWLLLPAFVVYMNRYQIGPEERALQARFGAAYTAYAQRVRRWV